MARVIVTATAMDQIKKSLALKPLDKPVLAVWWTPERVDPGWKVYLVDRADMPEEVRSIQRLQEIDVWLLALGRECAEVIVDFNNGEYVVAENRS